MEGSVGVCERLRQPVTTRIVRHMLGDPGESMPASTLNWWVNFSMEGSKRRLVVPLIESGQGITSVFTIHQAMSIGVAKAVKEAGHPATFAAAMARFVASLSGNDIESSFEKNESVAAAVRVGERFSVCKKLTSLEFGMLELSSLMSAFKYRPGGVTSLCFVDVKLLLDRILARLSLYEQLNAVERKSRNRKSR